MELKQRILTFLKEKAKKPLLAEDIAIGMQLTDEEQIGFFPVLEEMEQNADVIRNRSDLYGLPSRMHLVVGRISMSSRGFGFIVPDERESADEEDVFVPGPHLGSAMHNDRVVARVTPSETPGRSREGEIIRIVEHANRQIVGTFESGKNFGFVVPDDPKLSQDVFIPKKGVRKAKTGSKVVVEITKWPSPHHNAEGQIVEILGQSGDPGVDILSIMRKYELAEEFPTEVQAAADTVEQRPAPEEYRGRKDCRDLHIVTIDGEDSKDLDDGVYAEKREDGSYFLGVYIADVSWYVRENQPLDREAKARGTSVYLVDRVIPMIPKELSNGICSLNAGADRLAMACEMILDAHGNVMNYEILPAVIHVYRRLTYRIVNKVLVDQEQPFLDDQADILPMLKNLAEIRDIRKRMRRLRGSIDFEIAEVKVKLDAEGHPVDLLKRHGSLAESIIEECMLAANETVAEHMERKHLPFLYRVHEQPTDEKIERLNLLLATLGLYVRTDAEGHIHPMDVQKAIRRAEGKPEERIVSMAALRSMQQARYAAESLGHFGLAARYYTHFTSPIRRYPDLIVHRLLRETFADGSIPLARQEYLKGVLPGIAEHASQRERIAVEAERETTDLKKIEYMAQFIGEEYAGVVSGVTAFGIFVELENGVEGLVHVSSMVNDYYTYVEAQYALQGEVSGQAYRLGDEVTVILIKANLEERTLDFVLKDNSNYDGTKIYQVHRHKREKAESEARQQKKPRSRREKKGKRAGGKKRELTADQLIASMEPGSPEKSGAEKPGRRSGGRKSKGRRSGAAPTSGKTGFQRKKRKTAAASGKKRR